MACPQLTLVRCTPSSDALRLHSNLRSGGTSLPRRRISLSCRSLPIEQSISISPTLERVRPPCDKRVFRERPVHSALRVRLYHHRAYAHSLGWQPTPKRFCRQRSISPSASSDSSIDRSRQAQLRLRRRRSLGAAHQEGDPPTHTAFRFLQNRKSVQTHRYSI